MCVCHSICNTHIYVGIHVHRIGNRASRDSRSSACRAVFRARIRTGNGERGTYRRSRGRGARGPRRASGMGMAPACVVRRIPLRTDNYSPARPVPDRLRYPVNFFAAHPPGDTASLSLAFSLSFSRSRALLPLLDVLTRLLNGACAYNLPPPPPPPAAPNPPPARPLRDRAAPA